MIDNTINGQEILEEIEHVASSDEIRSYALMIGIDPDKEFELMDIAKKGIDAPLPENWKPCKNEKNEIYYFNFKTGESLWDHPMDNFYKELVVSEREKLKKQKFKSRDPQLNNVRKQSVISVPSHIEHEDLKIVPEKEIENFYRNENETESSENQSECSLSTESKSEDYGKDVNFGLDKSLTDRLSQNEPYGYLKDVSGTLMRTMFSTTATSFSNKSRDSFDFKGPPPLQQNVLEKSTDEKPVAYKLKSHENDKKDKTRQSKEEVDTTLGSAIPNDDRSLMLNEPELISSQKPDVEETIYKRLSVDDKENMVESERARLKMDYDKRIKEYSVLLDKKFQKVTEDLNSSLSARINSAEKENAEKLQTALQNIVQRFNVEKIDKLSAEYDTVFRDLTDELEEKVEMKKRKHTEKLKALQSEHDKEIELMKITFSEEKEQILMQNKSEIVDIKQRHKEMISNIIREKAVLENDCKILEARKMQQKRQLSQNEESERGEKYTQLLSVVKSEYATVKSDLMHRKSALEALQHEIGELKNEKNLLIQQVTSKREELDNLKMESLKKPHSRDFFDSAVLIDDAGVSMSYDTYSHSVLEEKHCVTERVAAATKSKELYDCPLPFTKFKSQSLPSLNVLDSNSIYFRKSMLRPVKFSNEFVHSLQKITADLSNIVKSLKSPLNSVTVEDHLEDSWYKSFKLSSSRHHISSENVVFYKPIEQSLQQKYNRIFQKSITNSSSSSSNNNNKNNTTSSVDVKEKVMVGKRLNIKSPRGSMLTGSKPYLEFSSSSVDEKLRHHKNWLKNFKANLLNNNI